MFLFHYSIKYSIDNIHILYHVSHYPSIFDTKLRYYYIMGGYLHLYFFGCRNLSKHNKFAILNVWNVSQCSESFGGFGSRPGGIVSLLLILPSRPFIVSSPPPWFRRIRVASLIASLCVSYNLCGLLASFRLCVHFLSGRP